VEGTEAKGQQHSLGLGQEVLDIWWLTCPGCLELLQPTVSGSQLPELPSHQLLLPFCQLLLPVRQLLLPRVQACVRDVGDELTGQQHDVDLLQILPLHC
jgi:hypothetical protein